MILVILMKILMVRQDLHLQQEDFFVEVMTVIKGMKLNILLSPLQVMLLILAIF